MRPRRVPTEQAGIGHLLVILVVALLAVVAIVALADRYGDSGKAKVRAPAATTTLPRPPDATDLSVLSKTVGPAVAEIDATLADGSHTAGSGIIVSADGEILTNNHLIANSNAVSVSIAASPAALPARVLGYDSGADIAVLRVDGESGLPAAKLGDSAALAVGRPVVTLGHALNGAASPLATAGRIAALHQNATAGDDTDPSGIEQLHDLVQIDAPIRAGDSGGPVVDEHGTVVAVNTAASAGRRFHEQSAGGVTFAVPIDTALAIVDRVNAGHSAGTVHVGPRATLGVTAQQPAPGSTSAGAIVAAVDPAGPSAAAGLKAGDVIASIDDTDISGDVDLESALNLHAPGDTVRVGWFDTARVYHTVPLQLAAGPPA